MKFKIRVLKSFSYWELDTFAEYLHNMSAKGWHFTGWGIGMMFEKGEPADICYAVEVFPKGSEMDTKAEPDAEEYVDYCEAAEWKFIDSKQKLCVFKKMCQEAISIVTPMERLENIKKAGWCKWRWDTLWIGFITAWLCYNFFIDNFGKVIFSNVAVLTVLFGILGCIGKLAECMFMLREEKKKRKQLGEGISPFYGSQLGAAIRYIKKFYWFFGILAILLTAYFQTYYLAVCAVAIMCFFALFVKLIIDIRRPARDENWITQIAAGIGIVFMIILVAAVSTFSSDAAKDSPISSNNLPLVQEDFRNVQGEITKTEKKCMDGILGTQASYDIQYGQKAVSDVNSDDFWYQICSSKYPWILKKIWNSYTKNINPTKDCTKEWGAESAAYSPGYIYTVLYQNHLLTLYSGTSLNKEQIQIIRTKLGLISEGGGK